MPPPFPKFRFKKTAHVCLSHCLRGMCSSSLGLARDILARLLGGTTILAEALHWVVAIWFGFTTDAVTSTTAFSATFVAVTALWGAVWNQTQFTCHVLIPTARCALGMCVYSQQQQWGVIYIQGGAEQSKV